MPVYSPQISPSRFSLAYRTIFKTILGKMSNGKPIQIDMSISLFTKFALSFSAEKRSQPEFFWTCTWRNGYLWPYIMFLDPRNPILRSKIFKNHGIVARIGPERAFLSFFHYFAHFLHNKSLKSMRKGLTFNRY